MKPLVSIIIPIYNTKQFVEEAVFSILSQNEYLKEIILVDDGSNDGTGELLDQKYGQNKLIKIIHTENHGQGNARNIGAQVATGEFIYFFDSDDIASKNLLIEFYSKLDSHPNLELFCFSGESFLDNNSDVSLIQKKSYLSKESYKRKIEKFVNSGEEAFRLLVPNKSFFAGPPLYILKKSLIDKFDLKFKTCKYEDEEFTHRVFIYAGPTFITDKILFKRRVRPGSTMQKERTFSDFMGYVETIKTIKKLKQNDGISSETKKILNKRIATFIKILVDMKLMSNIKLSREEFNLINSNIKQYINGNISLLIYYYFYPIEYKLRKLKTKFIGADS